MRPDWPTAAAALCPSIMLASCTKQMEHFIKTKGLYYCFIYVILIDKFKAILVYSAFSLSQLQERFHMLLRIMTYIGTSGMRKQVRCWAHIFCGRIPSFSHLLAKCRFIYSPIKCIIIFIFILNVILIFNIIVLVFCDQLVIPVGLSAMYKLVIYIKLTHTYTHTF